LKSVLNYKDLVYRSHLKDGIPLFKNLKEITSQFNNCLWIDNCEHIFIYQFI